MYEIVGQYRNKHSQPMDCIDGKVYSLCKKSLLTCILTLYLTDVFQWNPYMALSYFASGLLKRLHLTLIFPLPCMLFHVFNAQTGYEVCQ